MMQSLRDTSKYNQKSNDDFGNPFKEENHHLIILETNYIAIPVTVLALIVARKAGQAQF